MFVSLRVGATLKRMRSQESLTNYTQKGGNQESLKDLNLIWPIPTNALYFFHVIYLGGGECQGNKRSSCCNTHNKRRQIMWHSNFSHKRHDRTSSFGK